MEILIEEFGNHVIENIRVGEILYMHYGENEEGNNFIEISLLGNNIYDYGNGYDYDETSLSEILNFLKEFPYNKHYDTECKFILKTVNPHPRLSVFDEDDESNIIMEIPDKNYNPLYENQIQKLKNRV